MRFDFKTPGRGEEEADRLYTKADFKEKQAGDERDRKAAAFLAALGGRGNIVDVTNCATRLRVTVKDDNLVQDTGVFQAAGAHGLVHNGTAIQVIVGLSVPQVRERFEELLKAEGEAAVLTVSPELKAFADGTVIPLEKVEDKAFASKAMGDGIAILPDKGVITAPADGEVMLVMEDSKHALGLKLDTGMELLIHIGIDTVQMNGDGFELLVKTGQTVAAGQAMVRVDLEKVKNAGYSPVTMLLVTNFDQYTELTFKNNVGTAQAGKTVIATY